MRSIAGLAAATWALGGCCNGPLRFVECVGDSMELTVVDAQGDPVAVERTVTRRDGRVVDRSECYECGDGLVTLHLGGVDGVYEVTLFLEGGDTATTSFHKVTPDHEVGVCCSEVYRGEQTVVVDASDT